MIYKQKKLKNNLLNEIEKKTFDVINSCENYFQYKTALNYLSIAKNYIIKNNLPIRLKWINKIQLLVWRKKNEISKINNDEILITNNLFPKHL